MNSKKLEAAWNSLCVKKTNNKMYRVVVKCVKDQRNNELAFNPD